MTSAAACHPDFSPAMLSLFLRARHLAQQELHRRRKPLADELVAVTGLPLSDIERAFAGRLTDSGKRTAIWAALGHFPADFGIVFDDRGRQYLPAEGRMPDRASGGQLAHPEPQTASAVDARREANHHG